CASSSASDPSYPFWPAKGQGSGEIRWPEWSEGGFGVAEEVTKRVGELRGCGDDDVGGWRAAVEVADPGAGFLRDERAGAEVPGAHAALVVGVDAAVGDGAQVERGRAGAADVAHARQDVGEHGRLAGARLRFVREAGGDERGGERRRAGDVQLVVVAERTLAPHGAERLVVQWVAHDAHRRLAVELDRDRHREGGVAVEVVGRAVEGVDDPAHARRAGPAGAL